jgi:hypothetical protein
MNANLGIVFHKSDRETVLSAVPSRLRSWGAEVVEEEGPRRFSCRALDGVEFQLFPVTKFIRGRLPLNEQAHELEYAWMTGPALDAYKMWTKATHDVSETHALELGLVALLALLPFWALMFALRGSGWTALSLSM